MMAARTRKDQSYDRHATLQATGREMAAGAKRGCGYAGIHASRGEFPTPTLREKRKPGTQRADAQGKG